LTSRSSQKTPVVPESAAQAPAKPSVSQASTSPEAFQPSGEVKPLNIGDDAFSWLESLAAKQGAKPEELLTKPEDRSDEMPDWLRQPLEKPVDEPVPPAPAPVRTPAETLPLEPLSRFDAAPVSKPAQPIVEPLPAKEDVYTPVPPAGTTAQPATPLVSGEDDTLSWLERMTGDQEEKPEEPLQASVLDAATTRTGFRRSRKINRLVLCRKKPSRQRPSPLRLRMTFQLPPGLASWSG